MSNTGYARVSTSDQDPAAQIDALRAAGCDPIFVEHASGATMQRPEWQACNRGLGRGGHPHGCSHRPPRTIPRRPREHTRRPRSARRSFPQHHGGDRHLNVARSHVLPARSGVRRVRASPHPRAYVRRHRRRPRRRPADRPAAGTHGRAASPRTSTA